MSEQKLQFISLMLLVELYNIFLLLQEKLKPRVRDLLNKKRLVVFLVLDSHEEPIMDIQVSVYSCSWLLNKCNYSFSLSLIWYFRVFWWFNENLDNIPGCRL